VGNPAIREAASLRERLKNEDSLGAGKQDPFNLKRNPNSLFQKIINVH